MIADAAVWIEKFLDELTEFWGPEHQLKLAFVVWAVACAVLSLFLAVVFRAAAKWMADQEVSYGRAWVAMFWSTILGLFTSIGVAFLYGYMGLPRQSLSTLWLVAGPLFVIEMILVTKLSLGVRFYNAGFVTLATLFITAWVAVICGGIVWGIMKVMG